MLKVLIAGSGEGYKNYMGACITMGIDPELRLDFGSTDGYDGLILPGGIDLNPALYNEEINGSGVMDDALDAAQLAAMDAFYKAGKPIFGTCRGCQLINVYFGGNLVQDIPNHRFVGEALHRVSIERGSFLEDLYGKEAMVNSTHHQCVKDFGRDLVPAAFADDGTPEGFYHKERPVFAVQWHPERIMNLGGRKIYQYFIELMQRQL